VERIEAITESWMQLRFCEVIADPANAHEAKKETRAETPANHACNAEQPPV
jgi:hypothetical protein